MMEIWELLTAPLSGLELSGRFCAQSREMGFTCLEDILSCMPDQLAASDAFSYTWLNELTVFLEQRGLLHLLQSIPGKSSC
jgi:hypothetical protein